MVIYINNGKKGYAVEGLYTMPTGQKVTTWDKTTDREEATQFESDLAAKAAIGSMQRSYALFAEIVA